MILKTFTDMSGALFNPAKKVFLLKKARSFSGGGWGGPNYNYGGPMKGAGRIRSNRKTKPRIEKKVD